MRECLPGRIVLPGEAAIFESANGFVRNGAEVMKQFKVDEFKIQAIFICSVI